MKNSNYENSSIDIKDKVVSEQSHSTNDVTCGGSLENPTHKLSKKIEKSIFPGLSLSNPTEEDRNFIFRDENDNVMVVDKTPGESTYVWKKVTDINEYVSGGEYLFVREASSIAFDGSLSTLDVDGNVISVTIEDDEIPFDGTTSDSAFIISDIDGGVSIQSKSGLYIGRTSNSNGMNTNADAPFVNTISFDENGNVIVTSSAGPKLQKNSGGNRFRYFKSNQHLIQLYKKTEISVPDEYKWKFLVSNDDIDVITEEELDEILVPQCIPGNLIDC
jgi:hypothetical protein